MLMALATCIYLPIQVLSTDQPRMYRSQGLDRTSHPGTADITSSSAGVSLCVNGYAGASSGYEATDGWEVGVYCLRV